VRIARRQGSAVRSRGHVAGLNGIMETGHSDAASVSVDLGLNNKEHVRTAGTSVPFQLSNTFPFK
jgi:hypothetical protein